ncbi:MAG TPA: GNAT family N-acetyltransferase [Phycisphaerae bacterium]|nr:GNAT family N-acetyltransferase [Phycisphaerae bacterium]
MNRKVEIRETRVEEIVDLRHRVLRAGLPRQSALFDGDQAGSTRHFAAVVGGEVVGCLTLHLNEWQGVPAYQLRGMATEEYVRGCGVGMMLMRAAEAFVSATAVPVMWCNARVPAVGFYIRAGWKVMSEEFDIPTAGPHVRMVRRLR